MCIVRYRELNKIIAGVLAITLALITSPAISACAQDGHSAEASATVLKHSHHSTTETAHAHHQMAERDAPSSSCCDTQCQCVGACSAVLAVIGSLPVGTFELRQHQFDTLLNGDTQLLQTSPFRPPIQA